MEGNCFVRSTRFITDVGVKSFYDYEDGSVVNVLSHDNKYKKATVKYFGRQPIYKLRVMKRGLVEDIYCTALHDWRVVVDKKTVIIKKTNALVERDELPYIKNAIFHENDKTNWVVLSVKNMNYLDDVWCVEEPIDHNFTLYGGINTGNCTIL